MGDLSGIKIYPNPTNGTTNIVFNQDIGNAEVKIINTMNKVVYSKTSENIPGNSLTIDLSNLPKGIYFISLKSDITDTTAKIVIQ